MKQNIFSLFLVVVLLSSIQAEQILKQSQRQFSWDNVNNRTYLSTVKNQNFPFACNSGWAFATIGMLQSRIKKNRNASSPDISLSTQVLLSCDTLDFGCLGGQPSNALRYILKNNITDQTCHSYFARGYTQGQACTSQTKCQKCDTNEGSCKSQSNSKIYGIQKYGTIGGQKQMQDQIEAQGAITCGISITNQFKAYDYLTNKGIFKDKSGAKGHNHYVLIYGWGVDTDNQTKAQTKYWLGRNSWGTSWGQNGTFKITRGTNNLGIQNLCYYASLIDTWTSDLRNQTVPSSLSFGIKHQHTLMSKITYPFPIYLTSSKSILTPKFCQSSWAFSIVQIFRDRISLNTKGRLNVDFSVQALLNCGVGQCSTQTDPFNALSYINKYGIPEQSCQNYKGQRPVKDNCSGVNNCAACSGTVFNPNCTEVKNFKRWKIHDFGTLSGQKDMISQIKSNGPIVCGIDKTSSLFVNYQGGILEEISVSPKINHYVQVVGFGTSESGQTYWIARNFWGTAWGQEGFFRIKRGGKNLGIEKRCMWANFVL